MVGSTRLNPGRMFRVPTDDQLEVVHETSLRILERMGIRCDNEDSKRMHDH